MEKENEERAKYESEEAAIEAVCKDVEVEIPSGMIETEIDNMVKDVENKLSYQGLTLDQYLKLTNKTNESLRKEFDEQANKAVKSRLVLEAIIKAEDIKPEDKEVEEKVKEMAKNYGRSEEAVKSDHKILLFSGYTSMFSIIEEKLKDMNIKYLKLTGATKVDERMDLVDEFNENKDIKVFLISLKAGGTGLNLTGADMVIHYDPWWNLSTENQATDRAYRIGQKNNVQVYKLITKNTIEEKIYELQQKKAELIDNMLSTKTSFINKLSKEDIMNLFNN